LKEDLVTTAAFVVMIILILLIMVSNVIVVMECPEHGGEVHGSFPAECYGAKDGWPHSKN
jgi:hypothetical protein